MAIEKLRLERQTCYASLNERRLNESQDFPRSATQVRALVIADSSHLTPRWQRLSV